MADDGVEQGAPAEARAEDNLDTAVTALSG
jgi:hypothetical protein